MIRAATPKKTYEELLRAFKAALGHAMTHGHLPPTLLVFDITVIDALRKVAHSPRDGGRSHELIAPAVRAFARHALEQNRAKTDRAAQNENPRTTSV